MTMPFSANTTYVASSTPAVKAQDLNDLQTYLSSVYSYLLSIKGVNLDGVGNNNVSSLARLDISQLAALNDNALALLRDHAGNVKGVFDHLGYLAGRISEYRENWNFNFSGSGTVGGSRWIATASGTGASIQTSATGGSGAGGANVDMNFSSTAATGKSIIYGAYPWLAPQTFTSAVMEFEAQLGVSPSGATIFAGLTDMNNGANNAPANNTPWIGLCAKVAAFSNFQIIHGDGTTLAFTDTGVALDSAWHRVRIELHGSGSPYGACARLFLDGSQVGGNVTTNIPTFANLGGVGLTPQFGQVATATTSASMAVDAVHLVHNRVALSAPSV